MNAQILCLALTMATETFGPLPTERVELACEQAQNLITSAEAHGIDPSVMAGLIYVESRWSPEAVSRSGACGLTQVLPRYVEQTCNELKDPATSIEVGSASLEKWTTMRVRRNGRLVRVPRTGGIRAALACYNAGNACLESRRGRGYADAVLRYATGLQSLINTITEERDTSQELKHPSAPVYEHPLFAPYREEKSFYTPIAIIVESN